MLRHLPRHGRGAIAFAGVVATGYKSDAALAGIVRLGLGYFTGDKGIGPGGYRLGEFPPGWSEWNDRYRDTVRRFWRGDAGVLPDLARALHGSSEIFEPRGRGPAMAAGSSGRTRRRTMEG